MTLEFLKKISFEKKRKKLKNMLCGEVAANIFVKDFKMGEGKKKDIRTHFFNFPVRRNRRDPYLSVNR